MNNKIMTIENVNCYEEDGTVFLNLDNVARGLGFTKIANSGNEVVRWSRVEKYLRDLGVTTCGHDDYIPENVFYRLAMKAKNEVGEKFQAKVADEIIPSIRKHGAYMTTETLEKALTSPDFLIQLATQLKEEKEARLLAEQKINEQKPLVDFANQVSDSTNCISMDQMAKLLKDEHIDIGRNRLFKWLRTNGILMDNNVPYQRYVDGGYFKVTESTFNTPYGIKTALTTRVTGKGQIYITEKLRDEFS